MGDKSRRIWELGRACWVCVGSARRATPPSRRQLKANAKHSSAGCAGPPLRCGPLGMTPPCRRGKWHPCSFGVRSGQTAEIARQRNMASNGHRRARRWQPSKTTRSYCRPNQCPFPFTEIFSGHSSFSAAFYRALRHQNWRSKGAPSEKFAEKMKFPNFFGRNLLIFHNSTKNKFGKIWRRIKLSGLFNVLDFHQIPGMRLRRAKTMQKAHMNRAPTPHSAAFFGFCFARNALAQPGLATCRPRPIARASGSTSSVTTEPEPI